MTIWRMVDESPTLYVFGVAVLVSMLGKSLRARRPELAVWQDAAGAGTFLLLALRRLTWQPPTMADDVMLALLRSAAFGVIAFGIMGTLGIVCLSGREAVNRIRTILRERREARERQQEERRRQRRSTESSRPMRQPTAAELEQRERDAVEREQEREAEAADQQRRKELRMQTELVMEFSLDEERRQNLQELLDRYADESLSVEEFGQRLQAIQDAMAHHTPRRAKRHQSLQDVMEDFDGQLEELERSSTSELDKQQIRSMIEIERQTAIQRVLEG